MEFGKMALILGIIAGIFSIGLWFVFVFYTERPGHYDFYDVMFTGLVGNLFILAAESVFDVHCIYLVTAF